MKVCTLTKSISRENGGLFTSVRCLSQHLAKLPGVTVQVMAVEDNHSMEDSPAWLPIEPVLHPAIGLHAFGYSPTLKHDLLAGGFDLVHTHGIWQYPSMAALQWHNHTGGPHIISPRGMLDAWALRSARWKKMVVAELFEQAHLNKAACIHALNEFEAVSIRSLNRAGPICVIPNGIDLESIPNGQNTGQNAPWHQTHCRGRKMLLFLGRIHPKKGLINLLIAWSSMSKSSSDRHLIEDWVLVVAGWDQAGHELELQRLCTKLGIPWASAAEPCAPPAQIVFVGPQFDEAKAACYSLCDALILPSFSEGMPMAVLEAWSYEKGVVMTPECNLQEGFSSNAALQIETNPASIEAGLRDLFQASNESLAALGRNGRALVEKRYSWPKIVVQLKAVYDWALGGGEMPPTVLPASGRVFSSACSRHNMAASASQPTDSPAKSSVSEIRVLFITPSVSRCIGGIFEIERRLAQCLSTLPGTRITIQSLQDEYCDLDLPAWKPLIPLCHQVLGPKIFGYSRAFKENIMSKEADVAHLHALWMFTSLVVNKWSNIRRRPYVISLNGMLDSWALKHARWKKTLALIFYEQRCLTQAGCIHVNSEAEMKSASLFGLKNPIAIIPNGVDLPDGGKLKSGQNNAPWAGFIEPGRKVLLFLSRIHPKKGLVNLIKAWASAQKSVAGSQRSEWVLAIAGWDQHGHEAKLKRLCDELGVAWQDAREHSTLNPEQKAESKTHTIDFSVSTLQNVSVLFLGAQFGEDKAACYRECDAFILPSLSEGLPMVVLEAWSYQKPVLMTPECNLPEGFATGAALRIDPSETGIQNGLLELFESSAERLAEMGRNGRSLVETKFTWPDVAAEVKSVYEWLLGGGQKPGCVV